MTNLVLRVIASFDPKLPSGASIDVWQFPYLIGFRPTNHLSILQSKVSAFHAEISKESEGSFILKDCSSISGTFVNGERIFEPIALLDQSTVQFGEFHASVIIRYEDDEDTDPFGTKREFDPDATDPEVEKRR